MMSAPQPDADKARISALFDRLAAGYDHEALRFFALSADQLVQRLAVVTGTGTAALSGPGSIRTRAGVQFRDDRRGAGEGHER